MQIFWHGYSSIRVEGKSEDADVTLLTDPYENESSLRFPRTLAPDILALSHQDRSRFNLTSVQGTPHIISDPGEYEVKGVFVHGLQDPSVAGGTTHRDILYHVTIEGVAIGFIGQLKRKLTDRELEEMEHIDILLLPVGGGPVMDTKLASAVIADIEPRIVIPIFTDLPGIKIALSSAEEFCKTFGARKRENLTKLKVTKKDLPSEDLLVVVLERA